MALIDRDVLTCIGVSAQAHGVKGELKVTPLTDAPDFYAGARAVFLDTAQGLRGFPGARLRFSGRQWIVSLEGIQDRDAAESFRGATLLVEDVALRPLALDEYFHHDLIGCQVVTIAGRPVGRVSAVVETGANEVLAVERGGQSLMVPMTGEVIKQVDVVAQIIRIEPLPGLLELNEGP